MRRMSFLHNTLSYQLYKQGFLAAHCFMRFQTRRHQVNSVIPIMPTLNEIF